MPRDVLQKDNALSNYSLTVTHGSKKSNELRGAKTLPRLQMSRHIDSNSFLKFDCYVAYVHKTFEKTFCSSEEIYKVYFKMLEHNVYNRNYVKQHFVACALTRKENEF